MKEKLRKLIAFVVLTAAAIVYYLSQNNIESGIVAFIEYISLMSVSFILGVVSLKLLLWEHSPKFREIINEAKKALHKR